MEKHQVYADSQLINVKVMFDRDTFFAAFTNAQGKRFELRGLAEKAPQGHAALHDAYQRVKAADAKGKQCGYYLA